MRWASLLGPHPLCFTIDMLMSFDYLRNVKPESYCHFRYLGDILY